MALGTGPGLGIAVLGPVRIWVDGRAVPDGGWRSRKAREVLLVLALAGEAGLSRDEVIEAVWPERDPVKGRALLRTALSEVRQVLEPQRPPGEPSRFVSTRGDRVAVVARTDLVEAEHLRARARGPVGAGRPADADAPHDATAPLHAAWALFRGPFAADEPYTVSLDEARRAAERLQLEIADALLTAATRTASTGRTDAASLAGSAAGSAEPTDQVGGRPVPVGAEAVVAAAAHILEAEPWRTDVADRAAAACRAAGDEVQARRAERLRRAAPPE